MERRRLAISLGSALAGAGLGVAINLATELKGNLLAWVAVAILTAASSGIGYAADKKVRRNKGTNLQPSTRSTHHSHVATGEGLASRNNWGTIVQTSGSTNQSVHIASDSQTTKLLSISLIVLCLTISALVVIPLAISTSSPRSSSVAQTTEPSTNSESSSGPRDPVSLTVQSVANACTPYGTSRPVTEIGAPPRTDDMNGDYATWAQENDVAEMGWSKVLITIKSSNEEPVSVTGIDFFVSERKPVMKGIELGSGCGSETIARFAVVDLDQSPPQITESTSKELTWGDESWRLSPLKFPYSVSDAETETLLLIAKTDACECRWRARLSWSNGETTGISTIDYKGKPFHTSGWGGISDSYVYNETARQWSRI